MVDNVPALIKSDPEGVHQMRVGVRRPRAAMSLFAGLLHDPQTAGIKAELKWLTGELGPAREFEVLLNRVVAPIKRQRTHRDGMRAFIDELARKREAAAARGQNAVQSTRFGALTLDIAAWLQAGHWITPQDDLVRDPGDLPITIFAAEQLTRRWRKLRKKRKTLAQLNARGRHKLRIQTKKLRYAVEFFATLFASKRAAKRLKRLLPVLERLQDGLGELNDIAVDEERLAAIGIRRGSNPNRAFAAGLLSEREDARVEAAMAVATDSICGIGQGQTVLAMTPPRAAQRATIDRDPLMPVERFLLRINALLLMTLGRVAFKPIDEPGLGRAEEQPVMTGLLQRDKELLTTVYCLLVDFVPALEFGLERKLAAQRVVSAALAPDADVRVGGDPLAKIQHPEVLKHFLDDGLVHQFDPIGVGGLQCLQGREHAR